MRVDCPVLAEPEIGLFAQPQLMTPLNRLGEHPVKQIKSLIHYYRGIELITNGLMAHF